MTFASDSGTNLQIYQTLRFSCAYGFANVRTCKIIKTLRFSRADWVRECPRAVTLSFSISFDEQLYASRSRAFASVFFTRAAASARKAGSKPEGARRCNRTAEVRFLISTTESPFSRIYRERAHARWRVVA